MEGYLFLTAANILSILKWFKGASYEGAVEVCSHRSIPEIHCIVVLEYWKRYE